MFSGLMALTSEFNGTKWHIEQYPPGFYSKYQIGPDFKVKLIEEKRYYQIGDRPKFTPWFKYEGIIESDYKNRIKLMCPKFNIINHICYY